MWRSLGRALLFWQRSGVGRPADGLSRCGRLRLMRARSAHWPQWAVVSGVATAAVVVRLLPLLTSGGLRSTQGYDDGVHVAAAVAVLHGATPYRDFAFLHPPGIIALMLPLAAAAEVFGSDWALAAARVLTILAAAGVAALIAYLLRPLGLAAQVAGGGLYVVWGVAAGAERAVLLEPFLNLGLVSSLVLLRRETARSTVLAGLVLGLTCSIKVWPLALCAAVTLALLVGSRRRALEWASGVAAGLLVWFLPTAVLGGTRAYEEVVEAQVGRDRGADLQSRLASMDGLTGLTTVDRAVPQVLQAGAVALLLLLLVLAGIRSQRWVWTVVAVTALAEVLIAAPSFYTHYTAFVAPGVSLLAGCAVALAWRRQRRGAVVVGGLLAGFVLLAGSTRHAGSPPLPLQELQVSASGPGCSWSNDPAVLLLARAGAACAFVDGFGTGLVDGDGPRDRLAISQLQASHRVLLLGGDVGWAPSATVVGYITTHFPYRREVGPVTILSRTALPDLGDPGTNRDRQSR